VPPKHASSLHAAVKKIHALCVNAGDDGLDVDLVHDICREQLELAKDPVDSLSGTEYGKWEEAVKLFGPDKPGTILWDVRSALCTHSFTKYERQRAIVELSHTFARLLLREGAIKP